METTAKTAIEVIIAAMHAGNLAEAERRCDRPINHQGMNRLRRYREYLEPILPILRPMLWHWGGTAD